MVKISGSCQRTAARLVLSDSLLRRLLRDRFVLGGNLQQLHDVIVHD